MTRAERQKEWETRIAEYRASGQTAREWCAANEVHPAQLWYWLRKYKPRDTALMNSTQWLSVRVGEEAEDLGDSLIIRVGEASIEVKPGFNPALLSEVVRVLITVC